MSGPSLIDRMRGRGVGAIARRLLREVYAPETRPGRLMQPLSRPLWRAFREVRGALTARAAPADARRGETMTLFYDLDVAPITYDFVCFLALAEALARARGLAQLEIVFVPGRKDGLRAELQSYDAVVDAEARRWRLHNVCIPLTALAPSCRGYRLCATRQEAAAAYAQRGSAIFPDAYDPAFPVPPSGKEMTRFARQGEIKVLASPPQALAYVRQWMDAHIGGRKLVTITLRDYAYMPERNSNFAAWGAFARELDPAEYAVAIVPDTDAAMRPARPEFAGLTEFREACWNVALRSALYELAWLNLGSSGGPMGVAWFNAKTRYLMFKIVVPDVPQATAAFLIDRGYKIGEPPPFIGRYQKWVWEPDDLAVIRREFQAMAATIDASPAA